MLFLNNENPLQTGKTMKKWCVFFLHKQFFQKQKKHNRISSYWKKPYNTYFVCYRKPITTTKCLLFPSNEAFPVAEISMPVRIWCRYKHWSWWKSRNISQKEKTQKPVLSCNDKHIIMTQVWRLRTQKFLPSLSEKPSLFSPMKFLQNQKENYESSAHYSYH